IIRVGADEDGGSKPTALAALPAAADKSVEAFRVLALEGVAGDVSVEVSDETPKEEGGDAAPTFKIVVTAGDKREEHDGLTLRKGRTYIATKVNAASKLIKIEETGASLPEAQRVPATGTYKLTKASTAVSRRDATPEEFSGDVARRTGMGNLAAID